MRSWQGKRREDGPSRRLNGGEKQDYGSGVVSWSAVPIASAWECFGETLRVALFPPSKGLENWEAGESEEMTSSKPYKAGGEVICNYPTPWQAAACRVSSVLIGTPMYSRYTGVSIFQFRISRKPIIIIMIRAGHIRKYVYFLKYSSF